jgi:hypothetical protein
MLNIFSQFLVITAAAVISHIAYDTFVDNHAYFPLLVPFVYTEFYIPEIYGLPLEGAAILLVCVWDRISRRSRQTSQVCAI